jgi:preprotein translocase subunit SecG
MSDEKLKDVFQNINDLLKFAEGKHAGLLVFNSSVIVALLTIYKDYKHYLDKYFVLLTIFFLGLSIFYSILSYYPSTTNKYKRKNIRRTTNNHNLFFFGDIALLTESEYKNLISSHYPNTNFDKFNMDLVNQIIVQSKIANRKFTYFKYSLIATSIALVLPLISALKVILCQFLKP